jgi:hypothetical protein
LLRRDVKPEILYEKEDVVGTGDVGYNA